MTSKNALKTFQYNVSLPVDVVFDPIKDLSELAEIAEQPMSEAQKISMAFVIFQNTGKFKSDLESWNRKPDADKTWINMKTHFREAFQEIRDVEDSPVMETFDQENLVSDVLDGVREIVRNQVAEALPYVPPAYYPMPLPPNEYMSQVNMLEQQQGQFEYQPPPVQPAPYNHANMMA